jgi:hypothetical protein
MCLPDVYIGKNNSLLLLWPRRLAKVVAVAPNSKLVERPFSKTGTAIYLNVLYQASTLRDDMASSTAFEVFIGLVVMFKSGLDGSAFPPRTGKTESLSLHFSYSSIIYTSKLHYAPVTNRYALIIEFAAVSKI